MDRRGFLQRAGLLGAGLVVPSAALGVPFTEAPKKNEVEFSFDMGEPHPDGINLTHDGQAIYVPEDWQFLPLRPKDKPAFGDIVMLDRSHYGGSWEPHFWNGTRWEALDVD